MKGDRGDRNLNLALMASPKNHKFMPLDINNYALANISAKISQSIIAFDGIVWYFFITGLLIAETYVIWMPI